jgi:hypothetical protein
MAGGDPSPVEPRRLFGVPILYTGPWQAVGSYHGLIHGITDYGTLDPRGITERAQHGIRQCDICFALLGEEDCYGTLVEIGYAKGIGKPVVVGVEAHLVVRRDEHGLPLHQMGTELWFAIEMADVRLSGGNADGVLRQFAALLRMIGNRRGADISHADNRQDCGMRLWDAIRRLFRRPRQQRLLASTAPALLLAAPHVRLRYVCRQSSACQT